MTHQNHQTNGASLEDCHTNFFALADLCGIKWKKLVLNERPQATGDPLDDPVLRSYTNCLAKDILCVWRRVSQHKNDLDQTGGLGFLDISQTTYPSVIHPPLSLTAAKELWIFWYGEEPDLTDLVSPELLKSSDLIEQGSWESGLSYECRSLLFKALHNLIERCLLSRDIIRLGKWFVQPASKKATGRRSAAHLSFSFAFFVHGESTVCASMDIREHPPVRPISEEYLNKVTNNSQHNLENCTLNGEEDKDDANNITHNSVNTQSVILAPFGLSAVLTGNKSENFDQYAEKIINDWNAFYPLTIKSDTKREYENSPPRMPLLVEVISGGIKMLYPSKYVLLTDVDIKQKEKCLSDQKKPMNSENSKSHQISEIDKDYIESSVLHFCDGIQKSAAGVLPERSWQDSIMNPAYTNIVKSYVQVKSEENPISDAAECTSSSAWNFIETSLKTTCSCTRCKNHENFSSTKTPGISSLLSGKVNYRSNSNRTRTPFHKRSDSGFARSEDRCSNQHSSSSKFNIRSSAKPSGTHNCNAHESQQMSIGSVGSISASPMHQNLSVHSQPSSVPVNDQNIVSPIPPSDVSPHHPMTPSIENSIEQKPDVQALNKPMAEHDKNMETSQTDAYSTNENNESTKKLDLRTGLPLNDSKAFEFNDENVCLKRPALMTRDCENMTDEDYSFSQSLYDYSTWDAWLDHPIKRFKTDELDNSTKNISYDLYAGQKQTESSILPCLLNHNQSFMNHDGERSDMAMWKSVDETRHFLNVNCTNKETRTENDLDKTSNTENLFTIEGLQPTYEDLNKIFDNSEDNSEENDDHLVDNTPPGSNKSVGCRPDMDLTDSEGKRMSEKIFSNFANLTNNGLTTVINNTNNSSSINTLGLIRNEELSKMFPTPPSIEQHTNSSPGGICGNISDGLIENIEMASLTKQDTYQSFGSPQEEPIEDWSYVFVPPKMSSIVGSSKYAPLNDLLSQTLPPINLSNNCSYVPSWVNQKEQEEIRRKQKENNTSKPDQNKPKEQQSIPEIMPIDVKKEIKTEVMSPTGSKNMIQSTTGYYDYSAKGSSGSCIINKLLSQGPSIPTNIYKNTTHQPMESPSNIQNSLNPQFGSPMPGDSILRKTIGVMPPTHHNHPPPPYDIAIHSPSLAHTNAANIDDISNNNKKNMPNMKNNASEFMRQQQMQTTGSKAPEANSLLVNVLLYDTSLNIFRDHNFDSCTICVCNAGPNAVGNIRGLDSGVYLSLTSSCHFNENLNNIFERNCNEGKIGAFIREQHGLKYMGNNRNLKNNLNTESPKSISSISSCSSSGSSCSGSSGSSSASSCSGGMSPCVNNTHHQNGYPDEDPIFCRCGFSAVINRRLAHQTGLFYEDEMEITGMAIDPACFKKRSLLSHILKQTQNQKQNPNDDQEGKSKMGVSLVPMKKEMSEMALANLSASILDLLRDQCTLFQNSSNSIQRAIKHLNEEKYSPIIANRQVNVLEYIDAYDIISLALEQGRYIFERFDGYNNRMQQNFMHLQHQRQQQKQIEKKSPVVQQAISVHKWPFLNAAGPRSNQDIIRVMRSMKDLLQKAFNQNGTTGLWDAPYAVRGPLTWREFHRLAGGGIGQCEPQPIPSVVVGHDKEWLCISPYALQFWDKLLLEPYSYPRDIAYIVISPDNDYITSKVKTFFKELSTTYEMCRLGRHQPIKGWDGILRVGKNTSSKNESNWDDEWLQCIDNSKVNELLKMYGSAFQHHLVPYLTKIPQDRSLLNPPDGYLTSNFNSRDPHHRTSSLPSPMLPPHTPESVSSMSANGVPGNISSLSCDKGPNTPKSDHDTDTKENLSNTSSTDLIQQQHEIANPPHIVLYIVEPFTSGTDSTSLERVACLSLLKYYSNILDSIPESVRINISVQIIAQESIVELGRNRDITRWSDHMRNLSLDVFTQAHRYLSHTNNIKSLTGFGTAANAELFLKSKDEKNRIPVRLYNSPYILSTRLAKSEKAENFGQTGMEQQCSSIMYCCYCLSEDQSMLIAVVTDEKGEFLENCTINIDIPNRKRRKKAPARRIGLHKLMDFVLGVMSKSVKPWRLVIGRIGRIGHGELKGWSWLLSKPNLIKASKHLKDICKQCSVMYPQAVPSIWSACLVTLEPDSNFRVMSDQFTPDERFSQRSTQSPLSTPQDVSCTHILVFPTSAILQSSQTAFQEQHFENGLDFGADIFIDDTDDVEDDINGIQHLFDTWNESADVGLPQASPTRHSHRGSPVAIDENRSRQSPGPDAQSGQSRNVYQESEEVGQLLQQPLALGYLVSTAPTGRMPSWFWSYCPHLENVCPVFLKTALHVHSPSIHKENDDIYIKAEQSSKQNIEHPLDSNTTADVLRYVLEGYNVLSWLAMDSNTHDRLSCLPIHVQMLMQLYHLHTYCYSIRKHN